MTISLGVGSATSSGDMIVKTSDGGTSGVSGVMEVSTGDASSGDSGSISMTSGDGSGGAGGAISQQMVVQEDLC